MTQHRTNVPTPPPLDPQAVAEMEALLASKSTTERLDFLHEALDGFMEAPGYIEYPDGTRRRVRSNREARRGDLVEPSVAPNASMSFSPRP
jgi:hypothetical protein